MKPQRIQRLRVKGWRMPIGDVVYVGRPSKWGNPYTPKNYFIVDTSGVYPNWPSRPATLAECVEAYRRDLTCTEDHWCYPAEHAWTRDLDLNELRGKNLACWCSLVDAHGNRVPCHAVVLLELANQDDLAPDLEDFGCCELDDARGSGHEGPCAHICSHCNGSGECPACDGTGDDGSGLDYTCTECGCGSCPRCDEGLVTDD